MQVDKSSPYYYGLDSTYRPTPSAPQKPRPNISLDFYGVPTIKRPMADIRGSKTPGSLEAAVDNAAAVSAFAKAAEFQKANNPPTAPVETPLTTAPTAPVYNAEQQVKKHGVKKAEDLAMMEWAKKYDKLAKKVKPGQAGYDAIQLALGNTTVEPEDIRAFMEDSGMSAEEARARLGGGSVETVIDGNKPMVTTINQPTNKKGAEAFKNFAIGALQGIDIGKYKDLGENPFKIKPGQLLDQSVDFNIPGLAGTLGNYGTADYGELLKKYPNIFSYK